MRRRHRVYHLCCTLSNVLSQVCGEAGHNAGFVGSKYMDCPNKACYLCKQMVRCPAC